MKLSLPLQMNPYIIVHLQNQSRHLVVATSSETRRWFCRHSPQPIHSSNLTQTSTERQCGRPSTSSCHFTCSLNGEKRSPCCIELHTPSHGGHWFENQYLYEVVPSLNHSLTDVHAAPWGDFSFQCFRESSLATYWKNCSERPLSSKPNDKLLS